MSRPGSDDLSWLRRRDDRRVLEFLRKENARTDREMGPLAGLRERLYEEMRGRIQEADRSVPARRGDYRYYYRTEEGEPYRVWARCRSTPEGHEEVYLDENELARPHDFHRVGGHSVSPDHRHVALVYDTTGDESYTLAIRRIEDGTPLPERIEGVAEPLAWAEDSRTLFYVARDARKRAYRVYRHRIGFDPSEDALVFEEEDEAFHVELRKSRSRRFLFIESSSAVTLSTYLLDAERPERPPVPLCQRVRGVEFHAYDDGDGLLVRTNLDALEFRLLRAPLEDGRPIGAPQDWEEVVPHRDEVMLEGVEAFSDFRVLVEREGGVRHLRIWYDDPPGERVRIEDELRAIEVAENPEFETDRFRFRVSSFVRPPTVCDVEPRTGEVTVLKVEPAPGFDPERYRAERAWAEAEDGARIPISLLARRDVTPGEPRPCLLNGYGSYGVSLEPAFASHVLGLVDRGFVYAIAHVRGGGEMGERWHEQGKMLEKRTSFTDFIRCAETLIERGYTSPEQLGVQGRSAGGLLMGAVTNMRPELFRAVVAGVPFVDVLATMLDPSVPLTVIEYEEWGDPGDPRYYDYIRSYSPFDNVSETEYPHMLITTGLHDPRVQYWEPARWVARLRERRTDDRLLLLKTDLGAGHLGPSDRFAWLRDRAFEQAFLIHTLAPEAAEA